MDMRDKVKLELKLEEERLSSNPGTQHNLKKYSSCSGFLSRFIAS